jgi:RNA recognition motif-containing protein
VSGYGYVEMVSKSEGVTVITNLEGKKLRDRVVSVVEDKPLSNKNGKAISDIGNNNQSNRRRERKYQII